MVETPFIEISEIVEIVGLKLAGCLVEIPMRFVISLVLWSRVRER